MVESKIERQTVDTTLPKNIQVWVRSRNQMLEIMNRGDATEFNRLPELVKEIKKSEKAIADIKKRLKKGYIQKGENTYVEQKYNDLINGIDSRKEKGQSQGTKRKVPFKMEDGEPFTSQDITDAMRGGTLPAGFLSLRLQNKDSKEFKDLYADISLSNAKTEDTRKTQLIEVLRSGVPETKKEDITLTKEDKAKINQEKAEKDKKKAEKEEEEKQQKIREEKAKQQEIYESIKKNLRTEASRMTEGKKEYEKLLTLKTQNDLKIGYGTYGEYNKAMRRSNFYISKKNLDRLDGVSESFFNSGQPQTSGDNKFLVKDSDEGEDISDEVKDADEGIGGEEEGETIALEDVAEDVGVKGEEKKEEDNNEGKEEEEPQQPDYGPPAPTPTPPLDNEIIDNRGTVEEIPDILDASRGGVGTTPSSIVKGGDSVDKEDAQRSKMNILKLKEEIRALHLIYDNNIEKFRNNPHKKDKDDALKSDKVEVVRKHHKDMEISIREYYRSGGGDTLQVGVIVPIDTYLQQYLSGGTPNEVSIPNIQKRTTGREGTTSVGLGHRDGDLTSKKHDPYSRAVSQGIYYQRGGMGSYKKRAVSGHNIKIGGKDKIGQVKDPRTRVDAVMNNFLNRAVVELPNPSLKIKTK